MIQVPSGSRSTPPVARRIASSRRTCVCGEIPARRLVMPEVDVDVVPPLIGGGDLGNGPSTWRGSVETVGYAEDAADRKAPSASPIST